MIVTGTNRITGFYTLSACSIDANDLSSGLVKQLKFPRYPNLPATLVGRLARDLSFRGQRIGELLLVNALERALLASEQVASIAVVVDAKDEKAIEFYRRFGLIRFPETEDQLFLPMRTVQTLFPQSSLH